MLASQQQLQLSIISLFERSLNLRDNAPLALGAQRQLREAAAHRRWGAFPGLTFQDLPFGWMRPVSSRVGDPRPQKSRKKKQIENRLLIFGFGKHRFRGPQGGGRLLARRRIVFQQYQACQTGPVIAFWTRVCVSVFSFAKQPHATGGAPQPIWIGPSFIF